MIALRPRLLVLRVGGKKCNYFLSKSNVIDTSIVLLSTTSCNDECQSYLVIDSHVSTRFGL